MDLMEKLLAIIIRCLKKAIKPSSADLILSCTYRVNLSSLYLLGWFHYWSHTLATIIDVMHYKQTSKDHYIKVTCYVHSNSGMFHTGIKTWNFLVPTFGPQPGLIRGWNPLSSRLVTYKIGTCTNKCSNMEHLFVQTPLECIIKLVKMFFFSSKHSNLG